MYMEEGGVGNRTLENWYKAHEDAYLDYFVKELRLGPEIRDILELAEFLYSDKGQKTLQEYYQDQ